MTYLILLYLKFVQTVFIVLLSPVIKFITYISRAGAKSKAVPKSNSGAEADQAKADLEEITNEDIRQARDVYIEALEIRRDALREKARAPKNADKAAQLNAQAARIDLQIRKEIQKNVKM